MQMQDIASGALSQTFSHEDFVTAYALSPDRQTLITASGDKVTIWDVASTKVRSVLTEKGVVSDVALAADNHTLAIAGPQGVRLVDITNGKEITNLPGPAREVTFSEDGKQLATADDQGNATLYRAG
jgi:WD40 repeat protein